MKLDKIFKDKSVLVTGGAGFIGSHLVERLLCLQANVTVIDNLSSGSWFNIAMVNDKVDKFEGDIRDSGFLKKVFIEKKPELIFHLAANASVPLSVKNPKLDFESNTYGTVCLLEIIRALSLDCKLVFTSSSAVYGEPKELPLREDSSLIPISPYGASKLSSEIQCQIFHKTYDVPVVIGRVFNAYGPRMPRFVVFDFLKKLSKNSSNLEILGDGKQKRDFNYVTDIVEGLLLLALKGELGGIYNVASGISYTVTELAEFILDLLNLSNKTKIIYTGRSWKGDAQRWEVDSSKIKKLGYEPKYDLKKGLTKVIEWFAQKSCSELRKTKI